MEKLLITGANGFLGSNFLRVFKNAGFEIFATGKTWRPAIDPEINWITADLEDPKQAENLIKTVGPDYLIHLAWGIGPKIKKDEALQKRWIDISMNLMKVFARFGGKRVIVSGTCAEYEWGQTPLCEDSTPLIPKSIYGKSKKMFFQKLSAFCNEINLSYAWGRIFYLYGPNEDKKRIVPHVITSLAKDQEVLTTHGNQVYDYLYVDDVARAFQGLINCSYNGAVNICSGTPLKLKDLIYKIADQMNGSHLIRMGAIEIENHSNDYVVGSNERLRNIINWEQRIGIDEGIEKTIGSILYS